MRKTEIYNQLKNHPKKIRFEYLCRAAEAFGFVFRGGRGSHRVYTRDGVREIVNFQEVDGMAKSYQVKQLCKIIEDYSLLEEDDGV
jgi:predicted RNA binding protein YcfA (HicA-like mRNA interferase family)